MEEEEDDRACCRGCEDEACLDNGRPPAPVPKNTNISHDITRLGI